MNRCPPKCIGGELSVISLTYIADGSSDKEGLEFGVIVSSTAKFSGQSGFCPSTMAPAREPGEPQAWITVNDEVLDKPLDVLKRMIVSLVHKWPAISKVNSSFVD